MTNKWTKEQMQKLATDYIQKLGLIEQTVVAMMHGEPLLFDDKNLNSKLNISHNEYLREIYNIPHYCGLPYLTILEDSTGYHMLTVLCVSPYKSDELYNFRQSKIDKNLYHMMAYCINLDERELSEAGTVTIEVDRQNQTLRRIYY